MNRDYLIECIPNVSTADPLLLEKFSAAIRSVPAVDLRFVDPGKSANRTVFTYLGPASAVFKATEVLIQSVGEHIDMRKHHGVHPRMGALDVCPFVLLDKKEYEEDLIAQAQSFAQRIAAAYDWAIYGYEELATTPEHRNLAVVRKGQYEGLLQRFEQGDLPDFGPTTYTPSVAKHGATAMGVRPLMVAYNVNLIGGDLQNRLRAAKDIAAIIRERDGGMPGVKAIGWYLPDFNLVQVSCNLTKPHKAGVCEVFTRVQELAANMGFEAPSSELIGCIPQSQFTTKTPEELGFGQLKPFDQLRILDF